jgi:hypothetical protein
MAVYYCLIMFDSLVVWAMFNRYDVCEISGSRRGVGEVFAILGCYAAYVGSCLPMFRYSVTTQKSQGLKYDVWSRPGPV